MAVVSRNPQKQARADVRQITRLAGSKPGFQTDRQRHRLETGRIWSTRQAGSFTVELVIRLRHMRKRRKQGYRNRQGQTREGSPKAKVPAGEGKAQETGRQDDSQADRRNAGKYLSKDEYELANTGGSTWYIYTGRGR